MRNKLTILAFGAAALAAGSSQAQTSSGPTVYAGRVLVESANLVGTSTPCSTSSDTPQQGDSYGAVLRIPASTPKHWKFELLNAAFAVRVAKVSKTSAVATVFNSNGTLGTQTLPITAGGTVTTLASDAYAELPVTVTIPISSTQQCSVSFFAVLSNTSDF